MLPVVRHSTTATTSKTIHNSAGTLYFAKPSIRGPFHVSTFAAIMRVRGRHTKPEPGNSACKGFADRANAPPASRPNQKSQSVTDRPVFDVQMLQIEIISRDCSVCLNL